MSGHEPRADIRTICAWGFSRGSQEGKLSCTRLGSFFMTFALPKLMQYFYKAVGCASFFFLVVSAARAGQPIYPQTPASLLSSETQDDRLTINTQLTLGPASTGLWKSVQKVVGDSDYLLDFSKMMALLGLQYEQPADAVSPVRSPPGKFREDGIDPRGLVNKFWYAIIPDGKTYSKKGVALNLGFDVSRICISAQEVKRVYGQGSIGLPTDMSRPNFVDGLPVEIGWEMVYPPDAKYFNLIVTFADNGCLRMIAIKREIPG